MDGDDVAFVNHDAGVHAVFTKRHSPVGLAAAGVDADQIAAAGGEIHHAFAIASFHDRCREGGIHRWAHARQAPPDEFAGLFIETIHTVSGRTVGTPVGEDEVDDDEVTFDDRTAHTGVWEGHASQIFH